MNKLFNSVLIVLVILMAAHYYFFRQSEEASELKTHTVEVLVATNRLGLGFESMNHYDMAYVMTGNVDFTKKALNASAEVYEASQQTKFLVLDNKRQTERINKVIGLIEVYANQKQKGLDQYEEKRQNPEASELVVRQWVSTLMKDHDKVIDELMAFREEESRLLKEREARALQQKNSLKICSWITMILTAISLSVMCCEYPFRWTRRQPE